MLGLGSKKYMLDNKFYLYIIAFVLTMMLSNYRHSCFRLILPGQRNYEVHKIIKRPYSHVKHTPTSRLLFSHNLLLTLTVTVYSTMSFCHIVLFGDVEINPSPDSVGGSTDSSLNNTLSSFDFFINHPTCSIFHLNIQSILPKLDLINFDLKIISK